MPTNTEPKKPNRTENHSERSVTHDDGQRKRFGRNPCKVRKTAS